MYVLEGCYGQTVRSLIGTDPQVNVKVVIMWQVPKYPSFVWIIATECRISSEEKNLDESVSETLVSRAG